MLYPAVFLDRDNTLIRNDGDLGDPDAVELIQGAASAVASLRGLGFKVVVVTNQGGVARGKYKEADVRAVHVRLNDLVAHYANGARIDAFYFCPHHPEGNLKQYRKDHPDRKPAPGMLLKAADELGLDLAASWTVGDQVRDVQAGAAAGTRTILLRDDAAELQPLDADALPGLAELKELGEGSASPRRVPDFFAKDLVEAVRIVAQQRRPEAAGSPKLAGKLQGRKWDAAAIAELQRTGRSPHAEHDTSRREERAERDDARGEDGRDRDGKPARPFRPWGASEPKLDADSPIAKAIRAKRKGERPVRDDSPGVAAALEAIPTPPAVDDAAELEDPPGEAGRGASVEPIATPPPLPSPEALPSPAEGTDSARVLKQILQELRSQRGEDDGFSSLTVVAIVLQMVAGLCLVGALWMGADDLAMFVRWVCVGVLVQGATVAMLLFAGRR